MMVSQLRVSITVWRQRMAVIFPCWPLGNCSQSLTWMESSSCSAMPPSTLPSVACRERPSTTVTTALVAMMPERCTPLRCRMPMKARMYAAPSARS